MDNLTMNALAADRMGISYGIYKSIYPTTIEKRWMMDLQKKLAHIVAQSLEQSLLIKNFAHKSVV